MAKNESKRLCTAWLRTLTEWLLEYKFSLITLSLWLFVFGAVLITRVIDTRNFDLIKLDQTRNSSADMRQLIEEAVKNEDLTLAATLAQSSNHPLPQYLIEMLYPELRHLQKLSQIDSVLTTQPTAVPILLRELQLLVQLKRFHEVKDTTVRIFQLDPNNKTLENIVSEITQDLWMRVNSQ